MRFSLLLICLLSASCGPGITPVQKLANPLRGNCASSEDVRRYSDPRSMDELLSLINALPKPLELDCFLKTLKRPLYVNATSSTLSVQPADGARSPRVFIFKGKLLISFVPSGEGSRILEFSELTSNTRSIKGELSLPVVARVMPAEPFIRISKGDKSTCSGCHAGERLERYADGAPVFSSEALRPSSNKDVPLEQLRNEVNLCAFYKESSRRCQVLEALMSHGDVFAKSFPQEMRTLLNSFGG